jgi:anti-sigma regulatory factor (Ser/Thr protein kinase)
VNEENEIRTSASLESLKTLRDHAAACAATFGCTHSRVMEIELAVEEALVNIFNYAYGDGACGEVEMTCSERDAETLLIVISDSGSPFDPSAFPPPVFAKSAAERHVGGMGIPILRRYADALSYERRGDRNVLTISVTRKNAPE